MAAIIQVSRRDGSADTNHLVGLGFQPWIVVFTAALFFLYEFVQMTMFNSINLSLMKDFGINATQVSDLSSKYFLANVVFLIPAGLLLDRFSTRRLILAAMSVCIASNFVFAYTSTFWIAEVCRFVTGMGSTFCLLGCVQLASRWFPAKRLALVSGLVVTMAMLGGTLGQTPFVILSSHIGWRWSIVVSACFGLFFLMLIFFNVKNCPPGFVARQRAFRNELSALGLFPSMLLAAKNFQNWAAGLYTNILSAPVVLLGALWLDPFLQSVHGLTPNQASFVSIMIFVGMIFGSPMMGLFSDRVARRKWPMIAGGVLCLITILVIMMVKNLSYFDLLALFFLLGFFSGTQVISYALIPESNKRAMTGTALSLTGTLVMAAGIIFQPLFGWMLDHSGFPPSAAGIYPVQAYQHAMLILPIAFVVALAIAFFIKETKGRFLD